MGTFIPPEDMPPLRNPQPRAYVRPAGGLETGWDVHTEDASGHMTDKSHSKSSADAVAWATARCTWVLVTGQDGQLYWAGSEPAPLDLPIAWSDAPEQAKT